jgi:hypothetical protein
MLRFEHEEGTIAERAPRLVSEPPKREASRPMLAKQTRMRAS